MIVICDRFKWSIKEYLETDQEIINLIEMFIAAEYHVREEQEKEQELRNRVGR